MKQSTSMSQTVARLFLALCMGVGLSVVVCCTMPAEHTITVKAGPDSRTNCLPGYEIDPDQLPPGSLIAD